MERKGLLFRRKELVGINENENYEI